MESVMELQRAMDALNMNTVQKSNFMEGVSGVVEVTSQPLLGQIQRQCHELIGWTSRKPGFPGSQPVSMKRSDLQKLKQMPYKVSWKADGCRYLMVIDGPDGVFMLDRDFRVFRIPGLNFFKRRSLNSCLTNTLLDGEFVIDKVDGQNFPKYLVYDIIKFEGQHVGNWNFDDRLYCIEKEIIEPRLTKMKQGTLNKSIEPFSVYSKPFCHIKKAQDILEGEIARNLNHGKDGLIFQPLQDPYTCGTCFNILKWKPPSLNSIDFELRIIRIPGPGMQAQTKGWLYVKNPDIPFGEIKLTRHIWQYDRKIIECCFDGGSWQFMKERTDKSSPNSLRTAQGVLESIQNPVTKELLFDTIYPQRRYPNPRVQMPAHWRRP